MHLVLLPLMAVETILVGYVRDAGTGEVIENASVYFRGTKVGTTTNDEGFFYMRLDVNAKVKLTVSAVGYRAQRYDIEPGQSAGLEVMLEEKINLLSEVAATPGDNPAIPLMAAVRAHKRENGALAQAAELHTESRYFVSNIQPKHLRSKMMRQFEDGLILQADSTYLLPLPPEDYSGLVIPLPEHFDFYQSTIPLHTTSFLSPLSASAPASYRYYLVDSLVVRENGVREKRYKVHFLPNNTFDPLLEGVLEVDSATYGLRHVTASAPRNVNVNYLTGLTYEADYLPDGRLRSEHLSALFEMGVKTDTTHVFPSLLAERKSIVDSLNRLEFRGELGRCDTLEGPDSAMTAFLEQKRPQMMQVTVPDSVVRALQDSMANVPLLRVARWAAEVCLTGYIPTGTCVDIGRLPDIINITPEEGLHLGLPFRTNYRLWPHVSLGGYVGYGFRDRGVKWRAEMEVLFPTERRHLMRLTLSDVYTYTDVSAFDVLKSENSFMPNNLGFTSSIMRGLLYNDVTAQYTAARRREVRLCFEDDWTAGEGVKPAVETTLSGQMGLQGYGDPMQYLYNEQPAYRYASLRGMVRMGWNEQRADFYTVRRYYYGMFPTLYLGLEAGSYHLNGAEHYRMYARLNAMLRQRVSLGVGGVLSYLFEAGLVLGAVPYPQLAVMNGNQGYTYQEERFTLMNFGQYAADKYMLLHLDWNGRGVLFGRIPGVRYARLQELVEAKIAYGGLSQKNRDLALQMGMPAMQSLEIPYAEVGVGIGNILRIGDVYSVWRLTHRDDPSAALWAIRFRLRLSL